MLLQRSSFVILFFKHMHNFRVGRNSVNLIVKIIKTMLKKPHNFKLYIRRKNYPKYIYIFCILSSLLVSTKLCLSYANQNDIKTS